MLRILECFCRHRSDGRTWVPREELAGFWPKPKKSDSSHRIRLSQTISKAMREFEAQLQTLSWVVPNFTVRLESFPEGRAERYRLVLRKRSNPWDFTERSQLTSDLNFSYAFEGGLVCDLPVQVWRARKTDAHFEIEAVRETVTSEWRPPSQAKAYFAARDHFFAKVSAAARQQGRELHAGELWGIKDVRVAREDQSTAVHLATTRISYSDYLFLSNQFEQPFLALKKQQTYREWLKLESELGEAFCPARDALCVAVALVSKAPERRLYFGRQRRTEIWELTAAGAASSTEVVYVEDKPDLKSQILQVVARETGIKFKAGELDVAWLGFARSRESRDSSVIALVQLDQTDAQIMRTFARRQDKRDLDRIEGVILTEVAAWLVKIPPEKRGALLEVGVALVAMHFGLARPE